MKRTMKGLLVSFLVAGVFFALVPLAFSSPPEGIGAPRKIVVLKEDFSNEAAQIALLKTNGAVPIKALPLINAMAAYLPPQAEQALLKRFEVLRIDDDLTIRATAPKPPAPPPPQEVPWGIDRIESGLAWATTTGLAIKVAVLDSGIDLDHSDLIQNIKGNVNTILSRKSGNDDNGHGTHVAGTIASVNNTIGVVGVGPDIYLYAVKALDRNGNGWLSDLIEGLDWCINNKINVVNMSLGASADNQSFHDAIIRTNAAGVVQVAAAGNNGEIGGAVDYPGKYEETIAVSAVDELGDLAYFSSYGPEVDITAPGVGVKSTYLNGAYKVLNGTSMATPHVSAVAALVLSTPVGAYDLDADGIWDPVEVKDKIKATAENIALPPEQQGSGLVRADLAVQ